MVRARRDKPSVFKRVLLWLCRLVGYRDLFAVVLSFLMLWFLPASGLCVPAGATFSCDSAFGSFLAGITLNVVLLSAFTGLPVLLAIPGALMTVIDFGGWLNRRRERKSADS